MFYVNIFFFTVYSLYFFISVFRINFKTAPKGNTNLKLTLYSYIIPTSINNTNYYPKHTFIW